MAQDRPRHDTSIELNGPEGRRTLADPSNLTDFHHGLLRNAGGKKRASRLRRPSRGGDRARRHAEPDRVLSAYFTWHMLQR